MKGILDLVSKPENEDNKSGSRLDARDWRIFFLGLVSKPEIKCQKFSVSSRCARLNRRNSHSRLEIEKITLADLCCNDVAKEVFVKEDGGEGDQEQEDGGG